MVIVHLMASPFYGGPEKQMLGLALNLPASYRWVFLTFAERGLCQGLLDQVRAQGLKGIALKHNIPHLRSAIGEVAEHLRRLKADVLCCSGYKPDIVGLFAARRASVPVIAIAHGWTGATWKVRVNETLDRLSLRWMDQVVCVSEAQAVKVRQAGVAANKVVVIRNAVGADAFAKADPAYRDKLATLFDKPPGYVIGAAGRLSPEKGFDLFVQAAARLSRESGSVGFVIFGDGPLRNSLREQIVAHGLQSKCILAGFRADVHKYFPYLDLVVVPSRTEGLPVVLLEAMAAGVPVVAASVGGIPEVIDNGISGYLVAPGDPIALAHRLGDALNDESHRIGIGKKGRQVVEERFSTRVQGEAYQEVFERVAASDAREHRFASALSHCLVP